MNKGEIRTWGSRRERISGAEDQDEWARSGSTGGVRNGSGGVGTTGSHGGEAGMQAGQGRATQQTSECTCG